MALWVAFALIVQTVCMAYHATAMATGVEICTAEGAKRIGADGKPMAADSSQQHDCCAAGSIGAAPTPALSLATAPVAAAPAALITAGRLGAPWLAPLSRGPPALL